VDVTVEIAEPLGDEVVVHARAGQASLVFKQDPHREALVGSTIQVRVELDALHLFDAESQRRLGA
jgi:multiple sugar transport system ATP-binding protein